MQIKLQTPEINSYLVSSEIVDFDHKNDNGIIELAEKIEKTSASGTVALQGCSNRVLLSEVNFR